VSARAVNRKAALPLSVSAMPAGPASWALALLLAPATLAAAQSPPATDAPSTAAAPATGSALPQVTIEADRLRHEVYTYVTSMERAIPRDEAMRRWQIPVCPLVAGLPQDEGEFMLARLSTIVREVGAPLDKEHCVLPNFVIIVAPKPEDLLNYWNQHHVGFTGTLRETEAGFQRFRRTPRPIRVWYNHSYGSVGGSGPVLNGSLQLGVTSWGIANGGFSSLGSKMLVQDILAFSSVVVIVDGRKVVGLTMAQLTDYIAMVALSEPDLDARFGDAPTILRLFSARTAGQPLPAGLSSWDKAFLKGLYDLSLDRVTQRAQITDRMVRELGVD